MRILLFSDSFGVNSVFVIDFSIASDFDNFKGFTLKGGS